MDFQFGQTPRPSERKKHAHTYIYIEGGGEEAFGKGKRRRRRRNRYDIAEKPPTRCIGDRVPCHLLKRTFETQIDRRRRRSMDDSTNRVH